MPSPELPVTLAWLKGDALEPVGCVSALDHLHLVRVVVVARRGRELVELGDLVRGEQNVIGDAVSLDPREGARIQTGLLELVIVPASVVIVLRGSRDLEWFCRKEHQSGNED